ncbi:hypothetical protein IU433_12350 [Nocardia puris]|uniref:hypothetical protein n=1 Tax=Nocardia puris TaxID=208602 RepID=UPI00189512DC|nr:hypothetical protein [Nocardia puris]MBF6459828.1 hypothetical protein [Nocardia puris]
MPEHRPVILTDNERALLRARHHDLGELLAAPEFALERWRTSEHSGGSGGFWFDFTRTALVGTWHEWHVIETWPDGSAKLCKPGALIREVRITYRRLHAWRDSLPPEVLAQARTWWATWPQNTRRLDRLDALVLAQLADPAPPPPPPTEPTLFDLPETAHA